jgi:hypothetical protein
VKTSIRWWSRLAFVASVGMGALVACSSDSPDKGGEEADAGTLSLALQATSASGSVYRLRDARFRINNVNTGDVVKTLKSESGLAEAQELTTLLNTGDYTVTLLPGWRLERIHRGTGGGAGGTGAGGGMGTGGATGSAGSKAIGGAPFFPIDDVAFEGGAFPFPIEGGAGPVEGGAGPIEAGAGPGPLGGFGPIEGGAGPGPVGGFGPIDGGAGGDGPVPTPEVVEAQLLSNAIQFFSLFGGDEAFVHYQFKVGGEIIDFTKGRVHITIGVEDDDVPQCEVPPDAVRAERMLLESNIAALSKVSLFSVLDALTTNGGHNDDPVRLFQEIYDSYATADEGVLPDAVHCGDETTGGSPTLNGFPITCNRVERFQVDNLDSFFATAFVNRIDLAPANGAHCGQQRMIFASNALNRAFIIVEAQIPNPNPELGIQGCRPLAQFWLDQNAIDDPFVRGERLTGAFLTGDPELEAQGFGPFYTAENLTVGSGQIRTNQFDDFPWTLREFKLALDGDELSAVPFPVAESPNGALWNESSGLPQGAACRESFLEAADGLLTDDVARMSFVVDGACKDAESRNDFSEDYASQLSNGFRSQLEAKLSGTGLSANDIANRARFAGSCIGCHNEASNSFLGRGVFAPPSFDFVQVSEQLTGCTGAEPGSCFVTSFALQNRFLPSRMQVLTDLLGIPNVPNPCGGGGSGGSPGFGGSAGFGGSGTAGSFGMGGGFGTAGAATGGGGAVPPKPAPVIDIELPSAAEPIEALQEEDAEIRDLYGSVTISGRDARVTH